MAASYPIVTFLAVEENNTESRQAPTDVPESSAERDRPESASSPEPTTRVLAIASNKGGVGKTTVATNLAIYLRALREDLPVLILSTDDQGIIDRMFSLDPPSAGVKTLKHGWSQGTLEGVIQLGDYGVHFVPSPADTSLLKSRADNHQRLRNLLENTGWKGLVILDTKSDLESLTQNALHAAHRVLLPVADWASLEEAGKAFELLERSGLGRDRARILLTLVDRRTRVDSDGNPMVDLLVDEILARGWPIFTTTISRSPRVETLNSGLGKPQAVLHNAHGTAVHKQFKALAQEVLVDLELEEPFVWADDGMPVFESPERAGRHSGHASFSDLAGGILKGLWRR